jgi:hypothetical protein
VRLLERLNSPIAFAVVLVFFLALVGFLFYRYQQALQSPPGGEAANAPLEEATHSLEEESTVTEETSSSLEEEEPTTAE